MAPLSPSSSTLGRCANRSPSRSSPPHIELTGKEKQLGLMGKTLAVGIGTSYAEPIVAELLNEQTLIDLLTKGETAAAAVTSRSRRSLPPSPSRRCRAAGRHGGPPNTGSAITTSISRRTKRRTSSSR